MHTIRPCTFCSTPIVTFKYANDFFNIIFKGVRVKCFSFTSVLTSSIMGFNRSVSLRLKSSSSQWINTDVLINYWGWSAHLHYTLNLDSPLERMFFPLNTSTDHDLQGCRGFNECFVNASAPLDFLHEALKPVSGEDGCSSDWWHLGKS